MNTTRPSTIEFSSYLNSLITNGKDAPVPRGRAGASSARRKETLSRAGSRARAITAGAGGGERIICALSEGRGAATVVGICFIVLATNECVLCNITDSQTYIRTLQKLNVFDPTEILVPSSSFSPVKSKLCQLIETYFSRARIIPTSRKRYHAPTGLDFLVKWAYPSEADSISYELSNMYFTTCAAAAAIQYTQNKYHVDYATKSVRIKFQTSEDSMALNSSTIKTLELVHNSIDLKKGMSLFKFMNHTQTAMGARMLRSGLLQPLTKESTLIRRQDAVEELCKAHLVTAEIQKSIPLLLFPCVLQKLT